MHDCRGCQTPLHGHESFCPVCGQKQYVKPEFQGQMFDQGKQGFNPLVLILLILLAGGVLVYAVQSSWIGQVIRRGPEVVDPIASLSQPAAREKLETGIIENLASQSSTGKFTYMAEDKVVTRDYPQPVELTVNVNLKNPALRKSIIEPVKALMVPAHIKTITLDDARSHATLTYSVALPIGDDSAPNAGQTQTTDQTTGNDASNQ